MIMDTNSGLRLILLIITPWVVGWAIFVLILTNLKNKKRQKTLELIHKERMTAMEKGIPIPEWPNYDINGKNDWVEDLRSRRSQNPRAPLGASAILAMIGAGICLAFYLVGDPELRRLWPLGLIVVFTGLGVFLQYLLTKGGKA
jgi:hypothetical protein